MKIEGGGEGYTVQRSKAGSVRVNSRDINEWSELRGDIRVGALAGGWKLELF